jgi:hypothetical protein
MDWKTSLIQGKYHLSVAKRMFNGYEKYPDKRFLIGTINESAKATSNLIRAFLLLDRQRGGLEIFRKKTAPKYLDKKVTEDIIKFLEIEKAQKKSPVEFLKQNKIILLIEGKYFILTKERIKEFFESLEKAFRKFPNRI